MYDFCGIMSDNAVTKDTYEAQVRVLIQQFAELKKENNELKKQIQWRQDDLDRLQKQLDELQQNHDRLLLAYQLLSDNEDDKEFAKKKIDKMVREIDKCLNLLLE